MKNDYIDVDFIETSDDTTKSPNINISTNPISALLTTIDSIGKSITEYKMCKQQEETKRSQINATLKISLEQIHIQKECFFKVLDNQQQLNIMLINQQHDVTIQTLNKYLSIMDSVIEIAQQTKDFSSLINLITINNEFIQMRSELSLKFMDKTSESLALSKKNDIIGYLE